MIDMLKGIAENYHTKMMDLVEQTASEMMQQSSRLLETERKDGSARAQQLSNSYAFMRSILLEGMNEHLKDSTDVERK